MKKLYLVASLLATLSLAPALSHAAPPEGSAKGMKGDRLAEMKERLGLTPEQIEKLKPLLKAEREAMMALKDKKLEPKERREEAQKIRQNTRTQVETILTPEQIKKLRSGPKKDGPGGPGGPGGDDEGKPPHA